MTIICTLDGNREWGIYCGKEKKSCSGRRSDRGKNRGLWFEGFAEYGGMNGSGSM